MNTQKGLVPIVLILIIAVIAIGGSTFIYTQQKETSKIDQETNVSLTASTTVNTTLPEPEVNPIVLSEIQLKSKIKKYLNDKIRTCGPPVVHSSYQDEQLALFSTIQTNAQEFQEIIKNLNLTGVTNFTNEQKLKVVAEHNSLLAISLTPTGSSYTFQTKISADKEKPGYRPAEEIIEGTISKSGSIMVTRRTDYSYGCPICLSKGTLISTPTGVIAIENLQVGMKVWTASNQGEKIEANILKIGKTSVSDTHYVTHLKLKDGRELVVSPNHPTITGKKIGTLTSEYPIVSALFKKISAPFTRSARQIQNTTTQKIAISSKYICIVIFTQHHLLRM